MKRSRLDKLADPSDFASFVVKVKNRDTIDNVVTDLNTLGFSVERVMRRLGVVGVTGPACLDERIGKVPGVEFFREEGGYQLPPSHEDIPQ